MRQANLIVGGPTCGLHKHCLDKAILLGRDLRKKHLCLGSSCQLFFLLGIFFYPEETMRQ